MKPTALALARKGESTLPVADDSNEGAVAVRALTQLLVFALGDEEVRQALREAIGAPGSDAWVPLERAAEDLGVRPRVLRDAAARGELTVEGPRCRRVVRRSELDRWLGSRRVKASPKKANAARDDDDRALARGSVVAAAERFSRGRR